MNLNINQSAPTSTLLSSPKHINLIKIDKKNSQRVMTHKNLQSVATNLTIVLKRRTFDSTSMQPVLRCYRHINDRLTPVMVGLVHQVFVGPSGVFEVVAAHCALNRVRRTPL